MRKTVKYIFLGFLMLLFFPGAMAQKIGVSVTAGIASQRMDDLIYLQKHILSTYPVEGNITSSFPPFTLVSANLVKEWYDHIHIGGGYSFSTTGGKSSYSDQTGSISTEIDVTAHRLGATLSYFILERERLVLGLNGRVDVSLSTVIIESGINVLGLTNRIYNQYRSISPLATAGLELLYKFNGFSLGMDAGYLIDIPGDLRHSDDDDALFDPNDRERILTADWTGWHAGIKALVWLNF